MEHTPTWLINSFIYLSAAVIAVPLSKALGLGAIIGYLVAGLAIGPWGLGQRAGAGLRGCAVFGFLRDAPASAEFLAACICALACLLIFIPTSFAL